MNPNILHGSDISSLLNVSSRNTTSFENKLDISCNGEHFGYGPSISDCESAKQHIAPEMVQHTWGERHSGLDNTVFPLPYRVMGGEPT